MRRLSRLHKPLGMAGPCEALQSGQRLTAQLPRQHISRHTAAAASTLSSASAVARPLAGRNAIDTAAMHKRSFSVSEARLRTAEQAPGAADDPVAVAALAEVEAVEAMEAADLATTVAPVVPTLAVPGPVETAPRPGNVGDATYVPAESGEGLEEVGGLDGWWEDDRHWDPAVEFRGFGPAQRVTDAAALEVLARQAVLEALAVRSSTSGTSSSVNLTGLWSRGGPAARQAALSLDVDVAEEGGSVLGLRGDVAGVVAGLSPEGAAAEDGSAAALDADEARALVSSWDGRWKQVSLEDAALKFAITKRILQLTGHLLPDAQLASADTVGSLLAVLVRPPKPKKLAEELQADGTLASLPNVAVYSRRVTPIDKHKIVGRWKVIVQELEKRDLPVTGTGKYDKSVERKWVYR